MIPVLRESLRYYVTDRHKARRTNFLWKVPIETAPGQGLYTVYVKVMYSVYIYNILVS